MAAMASALLFSSSPSHSGSKRQSIRRGFTLKAGLGTDARREEVVIVGGGIAGLATALSLHRSCPHPLAFEIFVLGFMSLDHGSRLGVRSLVLEQGESLRTGGTSLTLFKNGWRVLDAIGVGDELRSQFIPIQG